MHNHHGPPHLIETISAGLLVCLVVGFAWNDLKSRLQPDLPHDSRQILEVSVNGLTCGGCVRKLEGRLADVPGVDGVQVQLEPGMARVQGTVEENTIRQAIQDAGFQPV